VLSLAGTITSRPIIYALNTSAHGDHSYGNMYLPKNVKIIQHINAKTYVDGHFAEDKAFMIKTFGAGRGIEEIEPCTGHVLIAPGGRITLDLGGKLVEIIDFGFCQTGGDLFVWERESRVLWTGNPTVASKPSLPWLLDGHLVETLETLRKVYAFLPADARVVPGHGVVMKREDIKWFIDYLAAIQKNVQMAIDKGLSLEETIKQVTMPEFRGYALYDWVHFHVNVTAAHKELSEK